MPNFQEKGKKEVNPVEGEEANQSRVKMATSPSSVRPWQPRSRPL